MHPDQLEGELFLAPGYPVPPNFDYKVRAMAILLECDCGTSWPSLILVVT